MSAEDYADSAGLLADRERAARWECGDDFADDDGPALSDLDWTPADWADWRRRHRGLT